MVNKLNAYYARSKSFQSCFTNEYGWYIKQMSYLLLPKNFMNNKNEE